MRVDPFRHGHAGREQHGRPVQTVETRDVLSDHVEVGRPVAREEPVRLRVADPGDVVDERVEPDVDGLVRIDRERNPPRARGARDRDVLEAAIDHVHDLVAPDFGDDELGMLPDVAEQRRAVLRELEEVVVLAQPLEDRLVDGAFPVDQVLLRIETLAPDAVIAFVLSFIDVSRGRDLLEQRLHPPDVPRLGRPDEVVVGDVEPLPDIPKDDLHPVAIVLGIEPLLARGLHDVRRMLIVSHEEARVEAGEALVARDRVGRDLLVRGPDVRDVVHVIDRGRQVELRHQFSEGDRGGLGPRAGFSPSPGFVPREAHSVLSQPFRRSRLGPTIFVPAGRAESSTDDSLPPSSVR